MSERRPDLDKRVIRLPDGRRLVYYRFPGPAGEDSPAPPGEAPPAGAPAPRPPGEER